ncbi:receptor-like protein 6, partial [Vigna umbellata]|uniref:receptor-like protein 6 n=1 Tax=Vigna umbellata TaxID=87088 RepID=UPI001F5EAAC1
MGWFVSVVLSLLLSHFPSCPSSLVTLCNNDEASALLGFKTSFSLGSRCGDDGGYPKTESWKNGTDCCLWDGVSCDTNSGHVIGLDLSRSCFHGPFYSNNTLFKLTHLQKLNLALNNFSSSPMPSGFGHLLALTHLNLSNAAFSGVIPSKISHLSKLVSLDLSLSLSESRMRVEPAFLEKLIVNATHLRELTLDGLDMSLIKPSSLSLLVNFSSSLVSLGLSNTILQGKLPNDIFYLPNLQQLNLSLNYLEGELPQLNRSTTLRHLDLGDNAFSGHIQFLSNLTQLKHLDLGANKFSNNFDGEIPNLFGKLSKLELLDLTGNNLVGQLPSSSFELTQISYLILSGNKLVGQIPDTTGGLSKLAYLDLSDNLLNGTIPSWCFSLSSLVYLILGGNQLTGPIGEFSGFSLSYCDLSNNKLQGGIPKSIFFHQNLSQLMLSSNNLSGLVDLRNFSNLQVLRSPASRNYLILDLSKNQIHGRIPEGFNHMADTLDYLDLSHNLLTSVGNLSLSSKNMYYIDLSFNMLEGDIPVPPSTVQFFSISNNKLTGDISSSLCNASSLVTLILSHNNLTGKLPKCVGNLSNLIVLDLQRNNLRGIIPRSYLEIETLETFNFNGNQLEGPLPRHVIKCKQLRVLDLGHNNIQDTFPSWLESLQELRVLVLRANRFNGTINCFQSKNDTFSKLTVFDISNNNFRGNLPVALFKNFKGMMINVHSVLQYIRPTYYGYNDSIEVT